MGTSSTEPRKEAAPAATPDAIPAAVSAGPKSPEAGERSEGAHFFGRATLPALLSIWLVDGALITAVRREALARSGAEGLPSADLPRSCSRTVRVATRRILARALESARP